MIIDNVSNCSICPTYPAFQKWKDGEDEVINTIANHENNQGDKYTCCRVFFSYTDLHLFSAERPFAPVPDMVYVINRIENLPKLREVLPKYEEIFSFQCRIIRNQRFTWAHRYTRENLEEFFSNFLHDHEFLTAWSADIVLPKILEP